MNQVIQLDRVNKSFGSGKKKVFVIHDLGFTITTGEVFGFLGPNGAGKSTTIKLLINFLRPDSGTLSILGRQVGQEEFRHLIGYLPEFPFFYDHLTARETLLLSGRLSAVPTRILEERISSLLSRMNLANAADHRIKGFSKGMKQRLGMANALIHDPEVLLFDEPMSGMDPLGRHLMKTMILELKGQGKTIFFSSHILSDIETLCDRIGLIHRGKLLYTGGTAEFLSGYDNIEERFVTMIREVENAIPA